MTATVTDLLAERHKRYRNPLHFPTPVEALAFCREQVREIRDQADDTLILAGPDLHLRLSQLDGVLAACERLYDRPRHDEENG